MPSFRELVSGFRLLGVESSKPVIVHTSLRSFGEIHGGAETLLGALLQVFPRLMAPTHTYITMIIPEDGPDHNGIVYGSGKILNRMAEIYRPDMPCDSLMGSLPETLRRHPSSKRSFHPILSFAGIGVDTALVKQTLADPLAPIGALVDEGGWVLLLGVDHAVNTSIHWAEKLAGRRQFVRWALTRKGVVECPGFPCCSLGFEQAAPRLEEITRCAMIGAAMVRALPLRPMVKCIIDMIAEDEEALLCDDPACERCAGVRGR